MERLIKTLPCEQGRLSAITAGQRLPLAIFNGRIKITEITKMLPILGTLQKGTKRMYASFIICGDLEYEREVDIHTGMVFEASADVAGEQMFFAGMRFENSDPMTNELTFEITDLELIKKLLTI